MYSTTAKEIIDKLSVNHILTEEDKIFINTTVNNATSSSYDEGIESYHNPCGCGQPSCNIC